MDLNKLRNPATNPIQERIQAQRAAISSSSTSNPNASKRGPTIPSVNTLKPPPSSSSSLAPPSGSNSSSGAMFPAVNSSQRAGARNKVKLEPGHSPLDWAHLNSNGTNLRGIHPSEFPVRVTKEMLKLHRTEDDCWTVLDGKVYNITRYLKFHPGGVDELLKCAGKDGTSLFMKYHAWVNYERMLENCLVGFYIG